MLLFFDLLAIDIGGDLQRLAKYSCHVALITKTCFIGNFSNRQIAIA
ncbi:MAG TPA: hypothetical protein V6D50_03785 [Chroococcales cyanobacterium]